MSIFTIENREQLISEMFPNGKPTQLNSRELFDENPIDWSVSRKRLLEAGIRNANEDTVKEIMNDYAYVVGIDRAVWVFFEIWGNMVERMMDIEDSAEHNS